MTQMGFLPLPPAPSFVRPGVVTLGDVRSWAVFSDDRRYRYLLGRTWDLAKPTFLWVMLNPSKAAAYKADGKADDDPTVRKCIGFSRRHGAGGIVVVNRGAFIATDPSDFAKEIDPIGPWNREAFAFARALRPARVIAAWGRVPRGLQHVVVSATEWLLAQYVTTYCLGITKVAPKEPLHPLVLSYATPFVPLTKKLLESPSWR